MDVTEQLSRLERWREDLLISVVSTSNLLLELTHFKHMALLMEQGVIEGAWGEVW